MSDDIHVVLDKRKLLLKYEGLLEDDFVSIMIENFTGCEASKFEIQLSDDKRMALVSFCEDVDAEAVNEEVQKARRNGKLEGKLHLEHPPINSKVIVRNLPLDVDKDTVTLYFESKKLCPTVALVKNVDMYDDGPDHWIAVVEFEESSAVDRVVAAKHPNLFEGNLQLEVWSPVVTFKYAKLPDSMPANTADGEPLAGNRSQNTASKFENVHELTNVSKTSVTVDEFADRGPAASTSHSNPNQQSSYRKSDVEKPEHLANDKVPYELPQVTGRESAKSASRQSSISSKQITIAVKNRDTLDMMEQMLYVGGLLKEYGCTAITDRPKSGDGAGGFVLSGEDETKLQTLDSVLTAFANEKLYEKELPVPPELAQKLLQYSGAWVRRMTRRDKGDVVAITDRYGQSLVVALNQSVADRAAENLGDHLLCGKVPVDAAQRRKCSADPSLVDRLKNAASGFPVTVKTSKSEITVIGVPSFVVKVVGQIQELLP